MAIQHFVLTLDGAAQRLSEVLTDPTRSGRFDIPLRTVSLQPAGGNANPIFVGAAVDVSTTDFGIRLEPGATGVPPAPFILGEHESGPLRLSDFYVIGTAAQALHILIVAA